MKNNKMMKKMENGEKVIGMLCHMTIRLWYRSRNCTPSWASDDEEEYRGDGEISEETSDEAEHPLTVPMHKPHLGKHQLGNTAQQW